MASVGLQSHIWNNNLKSILLLAAYPAIMVALFAALVYLFAYSTSGDSITGAGIPEIANFKAQEIIFEYWPLIVTIVGIWFTIAWFFHTRMVRALSHSHPVTRAEEPELYNLLENLCISQGMKTPKLEIIETHARNAFASGVNENTYSVTVTRGLLQSLSKDEVEAVLAHELTHIINRDVRLLIVTIIFTSMIGFAAQMAWSSLRYSLWIPNSRSNNRGGNGALILLLSAVAILWIGYMATLIMRFALTRKREYLADAGAVAMTKNPEAMMRALMRIAGMEQIPKIPDDVNMMCVENSKPFMGLFATHPPIQKRIAVLSETTRTPIPDQPLKVRVSRAEAHSTPLDRRDNWTTRERFKHRKNPWV